MEGVMMKNKDVYAVAVRKPDNEIAVETNSHKDFSDRVKLFKLPIFRGMLAFVDSMVIGVKVLNFSASFFDDEDDTQAKKKNKKAIETDEDFIMEEAAASPNDQVKEETAPKAKKEDKSNALLMALAVLISIVMSVALFMVLPVILTNFFSKLITDRYLILFIEGMVRLGIFIGYVILASRMNEIKRVFMYHGAEHKTINCLENGFELTVENVRWQSKQHKRCGTSFMLLVILISLVFFMFVPVNNLLWKVISRILLVPFIAGVSYEFIRLAGKSENKVVHILSQPGLWMQALTTKEPDDSMIEVAIQSVSAVYDWKAFLGTSALEEKESRKKAARQSAPKQNNSNTKQSTAKQATVKKNGAGQRDIKQNDIKQNDIKQNDIKQNDVKQDNVKQSSTKANAGSGAGKQSEYKAADKNMSAKNQKAGESKPTPGKDDRAALDVKPQLGGLAYTGKVENFNSAASNLNAPKRNKGTAPVTLRPNLSAAEEEDDDILKALDKFFDDDKKKA